MAFDRYLIVPESDRLTVVKQSTPILKFPVHRNCIIPVFIQTIIIGTNIESRIKWSNTYLSEGEERYNTNDHIFRHFDFLLLRPFGGYSNLSWLPHFLTFSDLFRKLSLLPNWLCIIVNNIGIILSCVIHYLCLTASH